MKFLFGLLFLVVTSSAMAQMNVQLNRDNFRREAPDFRVLENPARIEIEPMYKNFISSVEELYGVKCGKLEINYGYRGFIERDRLKTKCSSDKGSVTVKVLIQNSADKVFIRSLKVIPGRGMRSQF